MILVHQKCAINGGAKQGRKYMSLHTQLEMVVLEGKKFKEFNQLIVIYLLRYLICLILEIFYPGVQKLWQKKIFTTTKNPEIKNLYKIYNVRIDKTLRTFFSIKLASSAICV